MLDSLLSWNSVYEFPLQQLGARTLAQEGDDFSGRSDIEEKWIFDRLHAPQNMCWGDDLSAWDLDLTEHETFTANCKLKPTSSKSNIHVLRHGLEGQPERNKYDFISLVPFEGTSGKRTIGICKASSKLLAVAPLVPSVLGTFSASLPDVFATRMKSQPGPFKGQPQIYGWSIP